MDDVISESSLSRVYRKMQKHSCGMISAFRKSLTKNKNISRNREVLAVLLANGYSVTTVQGNFIEDEKSENATPDKETSFFIANEKVDGDDNGELEDLLLKLGEKYGQDSILSIRNGVGIIIGTSDSEYAFPAKGERKVLSHARYDRIIGEYYSIIRGRKFSFPEVEIKEDISLPDTLLGRYAMKIISRGVHKTI